MGACRVKIESRKKGMVSSALWCHSKTWSKTSEQSSCTLKTNVRFTYNSNEVAYYDIRHIYLILTIISGDPNDWVEVHPFFHVLDGELLCSSCDVSTCLRTCDRDFDCIGKCKLDPLFNTLKKNFLFA